MGANYVNRPCAHLFFRIHPIGRCALAPVSLHYSCPFTWFAVYTKYLFSHYAPSLNCPVVCRDASLPVDLVDAPFFFEFINKSANKENAANEHLIYQYRDALSFQFPTDSHLRTEIHLAFRTRKQSIERPQIELLFSIPNPICVSFW